MEVNPKIESLYKFIKELCALNQSTIMDVTKQIWSYPIKNIPIDEKNIELFYRDRIEEEASTGDTVLEVRKPEHQDCPKPDKILEGWLAPEWDKFDSEVRTKEKLWNEETASVDTQETEHFNDDPKRVEAFYKWSVARTQWAEKQKSIKQTRDFFISLYKIHTDLLKASETLELMIGNGYLKVKDNPEINHPLLLKRLNITFDPDRNAIRIHDTDTPTELYAIAIREIEDINLNSIQNLEDDLIKNDYHPLDRYNAVDYLEKLAYSLSSQCKFAKSPDNSNFDVGDRLLLSIDPVFFVRKRRDGVVSAVERILENINETGYVPPFLTSIVDGGIQEIAEDEESVTIEKRLASIGGEDVDILLSKEANREQLEIAQRIEKYDAVLVQGPPGTGKTHTIANLLGHFLSEGKTVLVTSHTKKALSVLKEKVAPELRDLCVSILNDTNSDMERSIEGITEQLSRNTSSELKNKVSSVEQQRRQIIDELADVRKKIFAIKKREHTPIIYNGESKSPLEVAQYVRQYADTLSNVIPGRITLNKPLPVQHAELSTLYRSNESVSVEEEAELTYNLPSPQSILSPEYFTDALSNLTSARDEIRDIAQKNGLNIDTNCTQQAITISANNRSFNVSVVNQDAIIALDNFISQYKGVVLETWMLNAATDGRRGGAHKAKWELLVAQIQATQKYASELVHEQFGRSIVFSADIDWLFPIISEMQRKFLMKGKITWLDYIFNKNFEQAMKSVTINQATISSSNDCDIVLHKIELIRKRQQCATYWNQLFTTCHKIKFEELSKDEPENIAANWIESIKHYLAWYEKEFTILNQILGAIGITPGILFGWDNLDSPTDATRKVMTAIVHFLPLTVSICEQYLKIKDFEAKLSVCFSTLTNNRGNSSICKAMASAVKNKDKKEYNEWYLKLADLYPKYEVQRERKSILAKVSNYALEWAEAISNRRGIHGQATIPAGIEDAWRWKQYDSIIKEISSLRLEELQQKSLELSKRYREKTSSLAALKAWCALLGRTERDTTMKQALQGWRLTTRRIGKGTGKNAPMLKAEARNKMAKCQEAVPAWIMPINKALESLIPGTNIFDVIIIDEASQAGLSSLAIAYLAKKIIIVGDDRQVSPMAIGVSIDKIKNLAEIYIKNKIPNWHIFDAKTSLYDIALTTFQPLMLREHFRCVPDIIGFSNKLSYNYKIKPLRDTSDCTLSPSVINYRVDGERSERGKKNKKEALTILSLILACIEQPEYEGKTFGVISLLGDEQADLIQQMIIERMDPAVITSREILCGNASHFQGDERDVVFLSMVYSNVGDGPLSLLAEGNDDAYKKRYNVATSRARDQLWVVNSLNIEDLKSGDLRKELLEYSLNPRAYDQIMVNTEALAESPFEAKVALALKSRGYNIVQQWNVGAYRIDMIAIYGNKKIAIECDGDKYHSGEDKIREDMERQTILERLGWRFIRIRGSEFYSDQVKTMERVFEELQSYEILPEPPQNEPGTDSDLLIRVKIRAARLMDEFSEIAIGDIPDHNVIHSALGYRNDFLTPVKIKDKPEQLEDAAKKPINDAVPQTSIFVNEIADPETNVKMNIAYPTMRVSTPKGQNANGSVMDSRRLVDYLKKKNLKYVDNSDKSSIIWLIHTPEAGDAIPEIQQTFGANCVFERRGSRATDSRPAWRIKS